MRRMKSDSWNCAVDNYYAALSVGLYADCSTVTAVCLSAVSHITSGCQLVFVTSTVWPEHSRVRRLWTLLSTIMTVTSVFVRGPCIETAGISSTHLPASIAFAHLPYLAAVLSAFSLRNGVTQASDDWRSRCIQVYNAFLIGLLLCVCCYSPVKNNTNTETKTINLH